MFKTQCNRFRATPIFATTNPAAVIDGYGTKVWLLTSLDRPNCIEIRTTNEGDGRIVPVDTLAAHDHYLRLSSTMQVAVYTAFMYPEYRLGAVRIACTNTDIPLVDMDAFLEWNYGLAPAIKPTA